MNWNELDKEMQQRLYEDTLCDVAKCCDTWDIVPISEVDAICPECGRLMSKGHVICGCSWSPCVCETCGAAPCDGSC